MTIRVGIDEHIAPELLTGFPPEAEIVRVPRPLGNTPASTAPPQPRDVDFWVLPFARVDAERAFAQLRGVQVVQSLMAGVDWITPWLPKEVTLCDGRGLHDSSTAEWVLTATLSTLKRFPLYRDLQQREQWAGQAGEPVDPIHQTGAHIGIYRVLIEELSGKTVLILGYGSIGAAIEARLVPFGARVLRLARSARTEPLVSPVADLHLLLPQADIVVAVLPLTPETRGLLGARELALLRPGAILVNAARGPILDPDALLRALHERRLRAVLDVTDPEPLPPGHPLWSAPNCLITPHIAGSSPEFIHRAFAFTAAQLRRMAAGQPLENLVGPAGY